jgi:hypothetical protein
MKSTKTVEAPKPKKDRNINNKVTGIAMLFVLASIIFSTFVVYTGTTGIEYKVLLIPQALFAAIIAIKQFTK